VFTVTGRLRANALFGSSRNTPFQGPAADGAILGLWELWRAGYKLVSAVHDQVVIECKADDRVLEHKARIERLMIEGMLAVVPGMNVKVETVVSLSLNKAETEPRYCEQRDL
jgi:DNA polymerase I-like protein with 3'-5' exonuclease and polymerase domains